MSVGERGLEATAAGFYALWLGIGPVMAVVRYEPAFTVLAKWFPDGDERRRAMTARLAGQPRRKAGGCVHLTGAT